MRIGLLAPSIYMSPTYFGDMIFAPRDLAVYLADGLVDRGHEVTFFTSPDIHTKATVVGGDASLIDASHNEDKMKEGDKAQYQWASFYGRKRDFEADLTARCFEMAKNGKLDVVHSFHDQLAHFFQDATGVNAIYTIHDPLPVKKEDLSYWLFDRFKDHQYISISDNQREDSALNFIDTVYNGIDTTLYGFLGQTVEHSGLLSVGRMVMEKGHDVAITAARAANIKLSIATVINDAVSITKYYTEKIQPFVDGKTVSLYGFLEKARIIQMYQQAEALIFPLQWDEPFGLIMIEAMACGTPVIAYNRGSVAEIVQDGVTGFIVDPDDTDRPKKGSFIIKKQGVEGLVEAIARIGQIDRAMCRKRVEEKFTIDQMIQGYEKVYTKIISSIK